MIAPDPSAREALIADVKWLRKFVEYARYELQPGTQQAGDQFPRQDAADKAMSLLDNLLAALAPSPSVSLTVSELRQGEENDGPLESTDLYVAGRGVSLLVNVPVGSTATYAFSVDGQDRKSGRVETRESLQTKLERLENWEAVQETQADAMGYTEAMRHHEWQARVLRAARAALDTAPSSKPSSPHESSPSGGATDPQEHCGCTMATWCDRHRPELFKAHAAPAEAPSMPRHGQNCTKVPHTSPMGGYRYLHAADDDSPYEVDGVRYCGRCHYALDVSPAPSPSEAQEKERYWCPHCIAYVVLSNHNGKGMVCSTCLSGEWRREAKTSASSPSDAGLRALPSIAEMRRMNAEYEKAEGVGSMMVTSHALALAARQFLRELDALLSRGSK